MRLALPTAWNTELLPTLFFVFVSSTRPWVLNFRFICRRNAGSIELSDSLGWARMGWRSFGPKLAGTLMAIEFLSMQVESIPSMH